MSKWDPLVNRRCSLTRKKGQSRQGKEEGIFLVFILDRGLILDSLEE
jgi:hypothetical protein